MPNRDEMNRAIHEFIGKCPGYWSGDKYGGAWFKPPCEKCTKDIEHHEPEMPDYFSPDSPRRLLEEVVAKVVSTSPVISSALFDQLEIPLRESKDADGHHLMLTAEQIATACYNVITEGK